MTNINESVRIIEDQEEYINIDHGKELDDVIYSPVMDIEYSTRVEDVDISKMSYMEVLEHERKLIKAERDKKLSPKPITFKSDDGYDAKIKSINSDGFISTIIISSDMNINNNY